MCAYFKLLVFKRQLLITNRAHFDNLCYIVHSLIEYIYFEAIGDNGKLISAHSMSA